VTCPQTRISYNAPSGSPQAATVVTCPQTRISYNNSVYNHVG